MPSKSINKGFVQQQVIIRNDALGHEGSGIYCYVVHTLPGRIVFSLKQGGPFLLISMVLMLIPGENVFYAFFLMLAVPYLVFSSLRLKFVSISICGRCPACRNDITLMLEPTERLTLWKYCPICDASLKITR